LTSTGRRTERRTRPDPHATVSRACVRCLRLASVGRRRSPPRQPSDIRCHRRARYPRRKPLIPITSRPRPSFRSEPREERRHPEDRDAFSRHDARGMREISPSRPHAGSLAHAAHTFSPGWGECFGWALQVSRYGHPRSVTVPPAGGSRVQTPLQLPENTPGTDDPSVPGSSTGSTVDGS